MVSHTHITTTVYLWSDSLLLDYQGFLPFTLILLVAFLSLQYTYLVSSTAKWIVNPLLVFMHAWVGTLASSKTECCSIPIDLWCHLDCRVYINMRDLMLRCNKMGKVCITKYDNIHCKHVTAFIKWCNRVYHALQITLEDSEYKALCTYIII